MAELEGERERLLEVGDQSGEELSTRLAQLAERERTITTMEGALQVGASWVLLGWGLWVATPCCLFAAMWTIGCVLWT